MLGATCCTASLSQHALRALHTASFQQIAALLNSHPVTLTLLPGLEQTWQAWCLLHGLISISGQALLWAYSMCASSRNDVSFQYTVRHPVFVNGMLQGSVHGCLSVFVGRG